jgi:hypothetical protein
MSFLPCSILGIFHHIHLLAYLLSFFPSNLRSLIISSQFFIITRTAITHITTPANPKVSPRADKSLRAIPITTTKGSSTYYGFFSAKFTRADTGFSSSRSRVSDLGPAPVESSLLGNVWKAFFCLEVIEYYILFFYFGGIEFLR